MPYVLSFNRPAIARRWSGSPGSSACRRRRSMPCWPGSSNCVQRVAVPHSLAAIGVDDGRADEVTRKAAADGNAPPIRTVGAAELRGIFDRALRGAL